MSTPQNRYRERKREMGMCVEGCGGISLTGSPRCESCRLKRRAAQQLRRYRLSIGVALDMRVNGIRMQAHECLRCKEPHAPGDVLCADHRRTMTEVADERRRGLWKGGGEDE